MCLTIYFFFTFQSTHPVRGATFLPGIQRDRAGGISIHAPREGCDLGVLIDRETIGISIHAPREGCDNCTYILDFLTWYFNPRTP